MTKKHFIALADAIRQQNEDAKICNAPHSVFKGSQLTALADFCEAQNGNFDRERWLGYIAGTNGKNGGKR
jgi:hypothetical protein